MSVLRHPTAHLAVAVVAIVSVAGCGSPHRAAGPDEPAIAAATVQVRADGCGPRTALGTGTSIADGLVVTAAHVVAGSDHVDVVTDDASTIAAHVVLFDPDLDLAVLRPQASIGSGVDLDDERPRAGASGVIAVLGLDGTATLVAVTIVRPVTIRTTDIYREESVRRPGFAIDARVAPGDSGAMVHLPGGGVGVVWARSNVDDDQAWAIDIPATLRRSSDRRALVTPVDTGPCTGPHGVGHRESGVQGAPRTRSR